MRLYWEIARRAVVERVEGQRQWLRFRRDEVSAAQLTAEVAERARLVDLSIEETDIEEVLRRIYRASGEAGELDPRTDDERVGAQPVE